MLGLEKIYHKENPFEWMELISVQGKTFFFFEKKTENMKISQNQIKMTMYLILMKTFNF